MLSDGTMSTLIGAMTTLISVFVGAILTFFATHYFKKHDEKSRQKRVMTVINAKLSFFLQEFLLTENGLHLYATFQVMAEKLFKNATFQVMAEKLFKNATFQDYQDIKQKLRENAHSEETKTITRA